MREDFKLLLDDVEYSVNMNTNFLTDHSWYVSVKEGEYKDVNSGITLDKIKSRIEKGYGTVGYITGRG